MDPVGKFWGVHCSSATEEQKKRKKEKVSTIVGPFTLVQVYNFGTFLGIFSWKAHLL